MDQLILQTGLYFPGIYRSALKDAERLSLMPRTRLDEPIAGAVHPVDLALVELKAHAITGPALLEAWVPSPAGEEVLESRVLVAQALDNHGGRRELDPGVA